MTARPHEPGLTHRWIGIFHWAALLAVLGLGAVLRFRDLSLRGMIFWDEAKFALEGIRMQTALSILVGAHPFPDLGKAVGTAKPTHALLVGVGYALFGITSGGAFAVDAALSVANLALVYLITRRLLDRWLGLIAALFLAVSEYDLLYARSALSESNAIFFLLLGFYILSRDWTRETLDSTPWISSLAALSAAIALGIGFTANYRLIVYIGVVGLIDLCWAWRRQGYRHAAVRAIVWAAGLMVAPLAWQLVEVWAQGHGVTLFKGDLTHRTGYLREAAYQLFEGKQAAYDFAPWRYVQWYEVRSGWVITVLVVVGLGVALATRRMPLVVIATTLVLPFALYSVAPFIVPRNMVAALPFAAMLAAVATGAIVSVARPVSVQMVLAAILIVAACLTALPASWQTTEMRSGFETAAAYLERHGHRGALTTSEVMVFYLRGNGAHCFAPALPLTLGRLGASLNAGYVYAVLDEHHTSDVSHYIRDHAARVGHYRTYGPAILPDNPINSENSNPPPGDRTHEYVDVYRIDTLHLHSIGENVQMCRRDEVT